MNIRQERKWATRRVPPPKVLLILILSFLVFPASARAQGWLLIQTTPYSGQVSLYVSPQGMKYLFTKMGVVMVSKAPQWKLTLYNDKARTYFQSSYEEWKKRSASGHGLLSSSSARHLRDIRPQRIGSATIAGRSAVEYLQGQAGQTDTARCWLASDLNLPAQVSAVMTAQLGLSGLNGLPLRVQHIDRHGKSVTDLDTISIRPMTIPPSTFDYPTQYKKVSDDLEVLVPEETKQTAADLLDELTAGPPGGYGGSAGTGSKAGGRTPGAYPAYGRSSTHPTHPAPAARAASPKAQQDINSLIDSFLKGK